ncbi:hypothetical protein [Peribacillus butanolivorans]|uniref:hypothetical protein n=1 Tax=Peribacillus butanolivorans TaxID=421767 RepID=UPI0035E32577
MQTIYPITFLKKLLPILSVLLLALLFSPNKSLAEQKDTNFLDSEVSEWIESKDNISGFSMNLKQSSKGISTLSDSKIQIFHNDGNPITSNITDNKKMNLFAVLEYNIGNDAIRDYYFSEFDTEDLEKIKEETLVSYSEAAAETNVKARALAATNNYIRNYSWSFKNSGSSKVAAKITTSVELKRSSSKTDIDGKKGSVWNISSDSQLENKVLNPPFINWYTRLAVPYTNQKLLSWGPKDSSAKSASVSLSGLVPGVSWNFGISGFNIADLSSKSSKYGRWKMTKDITNIQPKKASMEPGIRSTNTKGNFGVELSHTYTRAGGQTHNTGTVSIFVPDR